MAAPVGFNFPDPSQTVTVPLRLERQIDGNRYLVSRRADGRVEIWKACNETIQDMIESIGATAIEEIAQRLTAQLMSLLEIGTTKNTPLGRTWTDQEGIRHPVVGEVYDTDAPLFRFLLPQINREIVNAVATTQTHELDVRIVVSDPEHRTGLLDSVEEPRLKEQLGVALERLKIAHNLGTVNIRMELNVDVEDSIEKMMLTFGQKIYINENQVLGAKDTIVDMAAHASQRVL